KIDPSELMSFNFIVVIFSFLFVDLFDTLGTLIGVSTKADMLDENGHLPKIRGALLSDALGTSAGAVFGTSTTTTFVESAAGVAEGGRTGLTALVSAALFLIALFLSPIFLAIPSFATAPALVVVGFLMAGSILKIDFSDATESLPAFICLLIMPLAYSISEGIAFGFISYVVVNVASGKAREKKISPLMYVLSLLFILKYIFIQT
ncbi:MAG: solute carrier family 23 protein, partial [Acetivibrio ethanolgignens]